jgi:hypothetical protein
MAIAFHAFNIGSEKVVSVKADVAATYEACR